MTTKLSFACMQSAHWACPSHLGIVGFSCECRCHHDTITAEHEADDEPQAASTAGKVD